MSKEPIKEWEKEFNLWWLNHNTIMGGLSSNLAPDLKQFISKLISQERDDVIRKFATGEFIKTDIAEKFEKEIRLKLKEEIKEWAEETDGY